VGGASRTPGGAREYRNKTLLMFFASPKSSTGETSHAETAALYVDSVDSPKYVRFNFGNYFEGAGLPLCGYLNVHNRIILVHTGKFMQINYRAVFLKLAHS